MFKLDRFKKPKPVISIHNLNSGEGCWASNANLVVVNIPPGGYQINGFYNVDETFYSGGIRVYGTTKPQSDWSKLLKHMKRLDKESPKALQDIKKYIKDNPNTFMELEIVPKQFNPPSMELYNDNREDREFLEKFYLRPPSTITQLLFISVSTYPEPAIKYLKSLKLSM
nr:hypothetical protein [Abalone asfa-like virus]